MIFGIFDRFKKKSLPEEAPEEEYVDAPMMEEGFRGLPPTRPRIENSLRFEKNKIIYIIEVTNTTSEIMGGVNVMIEPARANIVNIDDNERSIEMLDPDQTQKFEFDIYPSMRCGKTVIRGVLEYFDFNLKDKMHLRVPNKIVSLVPPELKGIQIEDEAWRTFISNYANVEVETKEFESPPSNIFREFSTIIADQNLYMLEPMVIPNLYRGVSRYYGADREGSKYAVELQLIGTEDQSKFLLRAWGDAPERSMALCCKIIDDFCKVTNIDIKNYIIN